MGQFLSSVGKERMMKEARFHPKCAAKKMERALLLFLLILAVMGCSGKDEKKEGQVFYVLTQNQNSIVALKTEITAADPKGQIDEYLQLLSKEQEDIKYRSPFMEGIHITDYTLEGNQLILCFSEEYYKLDTVREVLVRAAIVRTLTQVEGVDGVSFNIGDVPLLDSNQNPIGIMSADSFIENTGEEINSIQTASLTLYFANEQGDKLVTEVQKVHYNSNISIEKLVMERLIAGPKTSAAYPSIPSDTKLVSIQIKEGICYVNLDSGFQNNMLEVSANVPIYSVVNSLLEIPSISKVQISINGDNTVLFWDSVKLELPFERNMELVENTNINEKEVDVEE